MRRIVAMARYSLAGTLRTPYTWVAGILLLAIVCLGMYSSARKGLGWRLSTSFLADGAIVSAVFGLRSGLIAQRMSGLQGFLRMNLITPVEHMTAAMLSLLGAWLVLCAALFTVALVLPGGGLGLAAWETWLFALRILPLLPFTLLMESVSSIQLPFFVPALLWVGLVLVLVAVVGEGQAIALVSPPVEPGVYGSTGPRFARALVIGVAGFGVVLGATRVRDRRG
jgi:hypothetical protein